MGGKEEEAGNNADNTPPTNKGGRVDKNKWYSYQKEIIRYNVFFFTIPVIFSTLFSEPRRGGLAVAFPLCVNVGPG